MQKTFQELIEWIDCSEGAVNQRRQIVRMLLNRYKSGQAKPEERDLLVEAMNKFKLRATNKARKDQYNALLCYYFADKPLSPKQVEASLHVDNQTVFRNINRGIELLTILLYGVGGVCLPIVGSAGTESGQENAGTQAVNTVNEGVEI